MLKVTHFEGLDNLWKQLFLLVPHSALKEDVTKNISVPNIGLIMNLINHCVMKKGRKKV